MAHKFDLADLQAFAAVVRHVQTVLGLVEAGLGVAAVPRLAMPTDGTDLAALTLTEPAVDREVGLITRRGSRLGPAAEILHGFIPTWGTK